MAKKNFKGGLDSLIENSLGMRKSKKGELKGNPIDLVKPEQTDDNEEEAPEAEPIKEQTPSKEEAPAQAPAPKQDTAQEAPAPQETAAATEPQQAAEQQPVAAPAANTAKIDAQPQDNAPAPAPADITSTDDSSDENANTLDIKAYDSETNAYLKSLITDLRKELFLWRNGMINVQSFNATLHTNGLKYNPENNEIEEI